MEADLARRVAPAMAAASLAPTAKSPMIERLVAGQLIELETVAPGTWLRVHAIVEIQNRQVVALRQVNGWVSANLVQAFGCN